MSTGKIDFTKKVSAVDRAQQAKVISDATVDAERDRRIDSGFLYLGKMIQSRPGDRENIAGAAQMAFMARVAGAQPGDLRWATPDEDYAWITADNSLLPMDAPTVVDFGKAAAGFKQVMIFQARALKNMDVLPEDYTEDKWWLPQQ